MRIAYLDCFSGISGDMLLGALLHAGVDAELLRRTVVALGVDARIEAETVDRCGISSIKVHVITAEGEEDHAHAVLEHGHAHDHHHDHDHHSHSHEEKMPASRHHSHEHVHARSLTEIRTMIEAANIEPGAREIALRAFELLGAAEAKIHNVPAADIHFHEVGAVDAIVDIVCAAVGCASLKVERWLCSPLNVGGGTVECAHGTFPVPAPATVELLKGAPVYSSGVQKELVTPTGAALLRALNVEFAAMPPLTLDRVGYGAGSRNLEGIANVVRLTIGETADAGPETVSVLETTVDDASPQLIGYVIEQALAAGALDVFVLPVQMKKSRPGQLLTLLCKPADERRLTELLLRETTTLGVRVRQEQRRCLERRFESVSTEWGEVRIKLGYLRGELVNVAPEFEDCRRIATERGVPLKAVLQEAMRCAEQLRAAAAR